MLPPALEYLRIRAIASPAVMVMAVAQGACLGQQDAWTPLQVRWQIHSAWPGATEEQVARGDWHDDANVM
jgi:hypothetical protein